MAEVLVICPNHGIVKRIEMDCMWLGRPPMPEVENAFCPICGAKTIIERPDRKATHSVYTWTKKDARKAKQDEIDYYKEKYKDKFKKNRFKDLFKVEKGGDSE